MTNLTDFKSAMVSVSFKKDGKQIEPFAKSNVGPRHDCPDPNGKLESAFATVVPAFAHGFTVQNFDRFSLLAEGADGTTMPPVIFEISPCGLFIGDYALRHAVQSSILT